MNLLDLTTSQMILVIMAIMNGALFLKERMSFEENEFFSITMYNHVQTHGLKIKHLLLGLFLVCVIPLCLLLELVTILFITIGKRIYFRIKPVLDKELIKPKGD